MSYIFADHRVLYSAAVVIQMCLVAKQLSVSPIPLQHLYLVEETVEEELHLARNQLLTSGLVAITVTDLGLRHLVSHLAHANSKSKFIWNGVVYSDELHRVNMRVLVCVFSLVIGLMKQCNADVLLAQSWFCILRHCKIFHYFDTRFIDFSEM